jgi:trk system potassium uptake protein TrkH
VVLSLALLTGHHMAARRLVQPGAGEPLATTARTHARRMLDVYLVMTVCGIALLWALGLSAFDAIVHVMSAVSTGGFSSFDGNLGGMAGWAPRFVVVVLAFCGALPLVLYYRAVHGEWRAALRDVELRGLAVAVIVVGALMSGLLFAAGGLGGTLSIANGMLLGLSSQTTAGFTSVNIAALGAAAKLVLVVAMAIGGGVGSTAGGIKMLRLMILLRLLHVTVQRTATAAHAVVEPRLAGRVLDQDDVARAALLMFLFLLVVLLSWLVFVAWGCAPVDALFEVTSATATAGLSSGITAASLATPLKVLLCLDMLLGRLEIVALLVLFYPPTWFGKRGEAQ